MQANLLIHSSLLVKGTKTGSTCLAEYVLSYDYSQFI